MPQRGTIGTKISFCDLQTLNIVKKFCNNISRVTFRLVGRDGNDVIIPLSANRISTKEKSMAAKKKTAKKKAAKTKKKAAKKATKKAKKPAKKK